MYDLDVLTTIRSLRITVEVEVSINARSRVAVMRTCLLCRLPHAVLQCWTRGEQGA